MAASLVSISTACSSLPGRFNVLGVVVDTLPLFRTKGSSKCVTFTIKDSDFDLPSWSGGLKVKYFNDDDSCLPIVQLHDVVLLRNLRVATYQNKPTGVVSQSDSVSWVIFRPEPAPSSSPFVISGPVPCEPSLWEKDQAQSLLDRVSAEGNSVQQPMSRSVPVPGQTTNVQASRPARKDGGLPFSLIKDVEPGQLYQLLGQVVKLNTFDSEKCLIYLTDYTVNELLSHKTKPGEEDDTGTEGDRYNYLGNKNDWPGPWGKLTIQVTLWEPHAGYAREHITPGDLVLLTYVRIKQARDLEASVHEDRRYPDKIHVRAFKDHNDDRVRALMDRRAEYWKIHGEPKKDAKKIKKQAKKSQGPKKEARKEEGQQLILPAANRTKLNANVVIKNYIVPFSPLEKILSAETHKNNGPGGVVYQLPFQNVNYRCQVRVIDFYPPNVEDFSIQTIHAPLFDTDTSTPGPKYGWEWRFCLLVEGIGPKLPNQQAREPLKLYVIGQDGDFLLRKEASNLRTDKNRLSWIKNALFVLWGNLEEQKSKALASGNQSWGPVSSVPFECCIKEYGIPCTHFKDSNAMDIDDELCSHTDCFGWERRFALFDTTINPP